MFNISVEFTLLVINLCLASHTSCNFYCAMPSQSYIIKLSLLGSLLLIFIMHIYHADIICTMYMPIGRCHMSTNAPFRVKIIKKILRSKIQMFKCLLLKYKHVYNLKSVVVMYCRTTQLYKQNIINLIIKFSEENIKISNIAG